MKQYYVLIGNFGSGKTELSLNLAINGAKQGKSILVDLDVINPYFRSAERKGDLEAANVKLLHPIFALTTVDVPSLPPDIYSVFVEDYTTVVFDVGGDPAGATALGQYKHNFENIGPQEQLEVLYVINPRRPFSATPDMILDMFEKIEFRSRLKVTGLVNNGNLASETTAEDLLLGYDVIQSVSDKTGVPVRFTSARQAVLDDYLSIASARGLQPRYIGEPLPITTLMHRDWDRFTELGV